MDRQLYKKAETVSAVLKQLAHPDRLRMLCCLVEGEKTVGEIVDYAGISQSWASQTLSRMRLEGLVDSRKEANFVYYRITEPRLRTLMHSIYSIYCRSEP